MSRHGRHEDGVGWNPNGVYCGECAENSCLGCKNAKDRPISLNQGFKRSIKRYLIEGILVRANDSSERFGPKELKHTSEQGLINFIEKQYKAKFRDIKIKELE